MKWGLFGGTFDPIHIGHLRCARRCWRSLLSTGSSSFPRRGRRTNWTDHHAFLSPRADDPARHRGEPGLFLFRCGEPAGRHVLLRRDGGVHPGQIPAGKLELYFILGQDAFHAIRTWKDWERLLLLCNFVVMTRPGYVNQGLETILTPEFASRFIYDEAVKGFSGPTGHIIFFREVTFLDIASSNIREGPGRESDQLPCPRFRPPLYRQELAV